MPARKVVATTKCNKEFCAFPFVGKKEETICVEQQFKVSLDNHPLEDVLNFLQTGALEQHGILVHDLDATQDMVGSFQKEYCIEHLLSIGFSMQNATDDDDEDVPIILDNNHYVGRNCLSFVETTDSIGRFRCKIYDKMVQMLESFSVRANGGSHWRDWATQQNTMLAKARDSPGAKDYGLTRFEITFYDLPVTKDQIYKEMDRLKSLLPKELVLKTPYSAKICPFPKVYRDTTDPSF